MLFFVINFIKNQENFQIWNVLAVEQLKLGFLVNYKQTALKFVQNLMHSSNTSEKW